jgi:hypothetical protein
MPDTLQLLKDKLKYFEQKGSRKITGGSPDFLPSQTGCGQTLVEMSFLHNINC